MTGGSLGLRTGSYGSLLQNNNSSSSSSNNNNNNSNNNNNNNRITGLFVSCSGKTFVRKSSSKMLITGPTQREKFLLVCCKYLGRRRVAMLMLVAVALLVFVLGSFIVHKETTSPRANQRIGAYGNQVITELPPANIPGVENTLKDNKSLTENTNNTQSPPLPPLPALSTNVKTLTPHPCQNFAFPPPPPPGSRRPGPRPCPVCYIPVEQAIARKPSSPSASPVLQNLSYVQNQNSAKMEPHGGSDFGGYPSLQQRNDSYDIKESMTVHCGFVNGSRPGRQTGFDIDEDDLAELDKFHEVIVASAIFGNYDVVQHPENISEISKKNVPFYMFVDEETEAFMKNSSMLNDNKRVGLWRIIVVHNIPYTDGRRNGKVPKLLLHRLFPNVRYSIWIDGKLQLVVDPYQLLERFLWRQNANFAISRHYKRFDVFVEAEANKAAGKYDNASIDYQIDFYKQEGLTPYSEAKLPITSDVPEGCVIIREHIPITNLFTCLWFNEVDRFTARDQLSFSTVRDKIMAKVNWNLNMFMDCERRNFVIQAYHRELLEQMPPPLAKTQQSDNNPSRRNPGKKGSSRRKKSGSKRHRKAAAGYKEINTSLLM